MSRSTSRSRVALVAILGAASAGGCSGTGPAGAAKHGWSIQFEGSGSRPVVADGVL